MATGHSLEHPAADANPALGDFSQRPMARRPRISAAMPRRSCRPPDQAESFALCCSPTQVRRSIICCSTSGPAYSVRGTRRCDLLRLVGGAVAAAALAGGAGSRRRSRGLVGLSPLRRSPVAFYYSVEGRMYSLLWCLALTLGWSTLRLAVARVAPAALWVLAGAAGLLTHYFFAFVWLACVVWIWIAGGARLRRGVLCSPERRCSRCCRGTSRYPQAGPVARDGDWLSGELAWPRALAGRQHWRGLMSGHTILGGWRWADRVAVGLLLLLVGLADGPGTIGRLRLAGGPPALVVAGRLCTGPLVFDLLRQTTTTDIPRYVSPASRRRCLLAALGLSRLPAEGHVPPSAASCSPGSRASGRRRRAGAAAWEPYRELDARLDPGPDPVTW